MIYRRLIVLFILVSVLVACASQRNSSSDSDDISSDVTEVATEESVIEEEEIVTEPVTETNLTDTEVQIALGNTVFHETNESGFACVTCHYTSERRLLGPGLANIAVRAADYQPDVDIAVYVRNSIITPTAFFTPADPAYPANIMPRNYAEILSEEEIDALVAYILSL